MANISFNGSARQAGCRARPGNDVIRCHELRGTIVSSGKVMVSTESDLLIAVRDGCRKVESWSQGCMADRGGDGAVRC